MFHAAFGAGSTACCCARTRNTATASTIWRTWLFRLPAAAALAETDAWLAAHLAATIGDLSPRSLAPLPLLGIPGVTTDSESAEYYRDTRQFRPKRMPARAAADA